MKAFLLSRPGDFGVLEDHWPDHPLFLPLPGGTVLDLHEAALRHLGIAEARLLVGFSAGRPADLTRLEALLENRPIRWSVRGWPLGPWPSGLTLTQALARQSLFLGGEEALVFSVPAADPRGWLGPKVPSGFPTVQSRSWAPWKWETSGRLVAWEGPVLSLGGTRDFFQTSLRFLETLPPLPLGLRGIHRQAILEAPLSLGTKVRADARSHLGPLVQLAAGSRLEAGTALSRTLVLTPTLFGRDMAFEDKIVIGEVVVEPFRGEAVPLPPMH